MRWAWIVCALSMGCQFDTFGSNGGESQSGSVGEGEASTSDGTSPGGSSTSGDSLTTTSTSSVSTLPPTVTSETQDDGDPTMADSSSVGGSGSDTTMGPVVGSSTGDAPSLVEDAVVVRYFLDEAQMGGAGIVALDATDDPIGLPIQDDEEGLISYVEVAGNRGVRWSQPGLSGAPRANIVDTELENLQGVSALTIEIVLRLQDGVDQNSRIFHVGAGGARGIVALGTSGRSNEGAMNLNLAWNDQTVREWDFAPSFDWERRVMHVVVDTSAPAQADRIVLFVDGVSVPPSGNEMVMEGSVIQPFSNLANTIVALGNRDQDRSFEGILYYGALYGRALSDAEIAHNVELLLVDDDTP